MTAALVYLWVWYVQPPSGQWVTGPSAVRSMRALKLYLTLLQAEPEPGTAAHICWIALMPAERSPRP